MSKTPIFNGNVKKLPKPSTLRPSDRKKGDKGSDPNTTGNNSDN